MEKGDKVSVIDQDLDGIVLSMLPDGKVKILDNTGMDWVFNPKELVVTKAVNPGKPKPTEPEPSKPIPVFKEPEAKNEELEISGLCLGFSTEDHRSWHLKLCNRTGYHGLLSISQRTALGWNNIFSKKLLNGHDADLANFRQGDLNDIGSILVEAVFFKIAEFERKEPISAELKIKPKKFLNKDNFARYKGLSGDTYLISVKNPAPVNIPSVTIDRPKRQVEKPKSWKLDQRLNSHREIDLHIEHLAPDFKTMTPSEMLDIQRSACISEIDSALRDPNMLSITIVHGHGKGTLKKEVIRILSEYGLSFNQDLYLRTGQAAIEVNLR